MSRADTVSDVDHAAARRVCEIVASSPLRRACIESVAELELAEVWIGAGFVRNAVFDALFGQSTPHEAVDIDVVYIDEAQVDREFDASLEQLLNRRIPAAWQVKNQARMASHHGRPAYSSISEAISDFPETATALAIRLVDGELELLAPYGLHDLFAGIIRPTPSHRGGASYLARLLDKRWRERWPALRFAE